MGQHVAKTGDRSPWHRGIARAQRVRSEILDGLTDDFQVADHGILSLRVAEKGLPPLPDVVLDAGDAIEDVPQVDRGVPWSQGNSLGQDPLPQVRVDPPHRQHVGATVQHHFKGLLELDEVEQACLVAHVDEHVDVAVFRVFVTRHRPEDPDVARTMRACQTLDLGLALSERFERGHR